MQYAPPADRLPVFHYLLSSPPAAISGRDKGARDWFDDRLDVSRRVLSGKIEVGHTSYPLRSTLTGFFYPGRLGEVGEFSVPAFGHEFVGHGGNIEDAYLDWRDQVHCRFQELYAKRPFEMTDEEKKTWRTLESQIDVAIYRNTTPLTVRQVGKVVARVRPLPELIEWEDGHKERVRPDQMPGEFVTYRPGQPFEAVVCRDPVDFHLLEVTHIRRISSLPQMQSEEFEEFVHSIPTTESLPDADWD